MITSLKNVRVKHVVRLRDRRGRDRLQQVLIEGYRGLLRALEGGYPVNELFVCSELFLGRNEAKLIERFSAGGTVIRETTRDVFVKMAYRDRPEGLLGVGPQRHRHLDDLILPTSSPPLILVAETIEKPGNLGTMLRAADAAGVAALLLCDSRTDLYNPNVVRASTGNLFTLPIAECATTDALSWLRRQGVQRVAATPHGERLYTDVDLTGPVAVAVGAEHYGLSDTWINECDLPVRIPMLGIADSLNVATATALLLYEAVRQRLAANILRDPGSDAPATSESKP